MVIVVLFCFVVYIKIPAVLHLVKLFCLSLGFVLCVAAVELGGRGRFEFCFGCCVCIWLVCLCMVGVPVYL